MDAPEDFLRLMLGLGIMYLCLVTLVYITKPKPPEKDDWRE